jgi:hypothetical protein
LNDHDIVHEPLIGAREFPFPSAALQKTKSPCTKAETTGRWIYPGRMRIKVLYSVEQKSEMLSGYTGLWIHGIEGFQNGLILRVDVVHGLPEKAIREVSPRFIAVIFILKSVVLED